MNQNRIPRWIQCGIFSILFLLSTIPVSSVHAQPVKKTYPLPLVHSRPAASPLIPTDDLRILALRVAFTPDENRSTTGDGRFLMESPQSERCDGFPVDPPPHGVSYFRSHLQAVANYFDQVSNGTVTIDWESSEIFPARDESTITLDGMASYRPLGDDDSSDSLLVELYAESVRAAADSGVAISDYDIIVVFHAGIGQDFAYPGLDPTPLDIPSASIDRQMIQNALGTAGISIHPDSALVDKPGLLLPEGQNHIYYDILEDIFPGNEDYCDVQIGLTGTFALLLGYALGVPPLYNTEDGETGIGVFGLMDIGSNNGQGTIPAPPTAWTRTFLGWEEPEELVGDVSLAARHLPAGRIGRISLGLSEYLLIENRSNWIPGLERASLDTLRYRNAVDNEFGGYDLPHYFDYVADSAGVVVDSTTGVIVAVPNYDLGLPGSGLLIWHIDESRYNSTMEGINDIPEFRAVSLVEADGAVDIGFPTSALFGDPNLGWGWDMWYAGNEAYFVANPERERDNPEGYLSLDNDSYPSTRLNSGAESNLAIQDIDSAGLTMHFTVEDVAVTRLSGGSRLLGFNGQDLIYVLRDSIWLADVFLMESENATESSTLPMVISEHDAVDEPDSYAFWILDSGPGQSSSARRFTADGSMVESITDTVVYREGYFHGDQLFIGIVDNCCPSSPDTNLVWYYQASPWRPRNSMGYLLTRDYRTYLIQPGRASWTDQDSAVFWAVTDNIALGDIDGDGYDEIVAADDPVLDHYTNEKLTVINADSTQLDGFPVPGFFQNAPLVANLMDDIRPEIVVVRGQDIVIFGPEGEQLKQLALRVRPAELFLFHTEGGQVGLANGDRIHWFEPDELNPQWVTADGRHSRNRYSLNDGSIYIPQPATLDISRVYNYPNPVTDGRTTIRFYTGIAARATIRIYTIDGLNVTSTKMNNLAENDYNEWVWEVGDTPSGLYYGVVEVEGAEKVSALIKIAIVR